MPTGAGAASAADAGSTGDGALGAAGIKPGGSGGMGPDGTPSAPTIRGASSSALMLYGPTGVESCVILLAGSCGFLLFPGWEATWLSAAHRLTGQIVPFSVKLKRGSKARAT